MWTNRKGIHELDDDYYDLEYSYYHRSNNNDEKNQKNKEVTTKPKSSASMGGIHFVKNKKISRPNPISQNSTKRSQVINANIKSTTNPELYPSSQHSSFYPNLSSSSQSQSPHQPSKSTSMKHTNNNNVSSSSSNPINLLPNLPRLSQGLPPFQHPSSSSVSSSTYTTSNSTSWMNKPPRSNWDVSDNKLKPIPPLHPPIPPNNMIFINDSSPSIVACRISSCLRKRSIIADYDDEAAIATCWSRGDNGSGEGELVLFNGAEQLELFQQHQQKQQDRNYNMGAFDMNGNCNGGGGGCVVFSIHLYRGDRRGTSGNKNNNNNNAQRTTTNNEILESLSKSNIKSSSSEYPYQDLYNNNYSKSNSSNSSFDVTSINISSTSTKVSDTSNNKIKPDFSHGIIVECMRIRGDTIQFHKDCRAIFASAKGDSDGLDDYRSPRSSLYHSPFTFKGMRSLKDESTNVEDNTDLYNKNKTLPLARYMKRSSTEITFSTFSSLERVLDLLEKDRLDAQLLGVKSLVLLTDPSSSGLECSYLTSLCILGSNIRFPADSKTTNTFWIAERLHQKVVSITKGKLNITESKRNHHNYDDESTDDDKNPTPSMTTSMIESQYISTLRSYIIHALTNALNNLIQYSNQFPLLEKPTCDEFMKTDFIQKICQDVVGASRPPMTLLGTAHEATHAVRFLRLLASYSEDGFDIVNGTYVSGRPIMEYLDIAYEAGLSSHNVLKVEADNARYSLTGHVCKD